MKTTKTSVKEIEEVSEQDNPPVLAYRVGQLELAIKDASRAQRENTESHKETADKLSAKMDTLVLNFATKADLDIAQREADKEHNDMNKHFDRVDNRLEKIEGDTDSFPLVKKLVFGATAIILISVLGAIVTLVVKSQS